MRLAILAAALLAGCAVPTTGPIPRNEGMYTITKQGDGFWVQPATLTTGALREAESHCNRSGKRVKVVHTKEIPAGAFARWPESEVLYRCE